MRIYNYNKTYELVPDEPNIFSREIIWIDESEYYLIGEESYDYSNRDIGVNSYDFDIITYVEDTRTGVLYITIAPDYNILLPIQNTEHIVGFRFDYHRRDNERASERSWIRASLERVYIQPYYQVDVKFRGHHWFKFVNQWLSFPLVYCCCKYFFDKLYPDGYDSYNIKYRVDFRSGALALNDIKRWFGKKSTRRTVTAKYCLRHYANKRDWQWAESVTREYGYNPLQEIYGMV